MAACAVCRKACESHSTLQAVYKCRNGHTFLCCKEACQHIFHRRCSKVLGQMTKATKASRDRRWGLLANMSPVERAKFKQFQEAGEADFLLCPQEDSRACDKSAPYCCCFLDCAKQDLVKNGLESCHWHPQENEDEQRPAPPPPPRSLPQENEEEELLVLHQKEEGLEEQIDQKKHKKAAKKKKEKKGYVSIPIHLLLEGIDDAPASPSAAGQQRVSPGSAWSVEGAASPAGAQQSANVSSGSTCWGSPDAEEDEASIEVEVAARVPPPPCQPPPPRMERPWTAVWCKEQNEYYFWNTLTNETRWELPQDEKKGAGKTCTQRLVRGKPMEEVDTTASSSSQEGAAVAPNHDVCVAASDQEASDHQKQLISRACNITGVAPDSAQKLLEDHAWKLEEALLSFSQQSAALREEKRTAKKTNKTSSEPVAAEAILESWSEATASKGKDRKEKDAAAASLQGSAAEPAPLKRDVHCFPPGQYVCLRHWAPKAEVKDCLTVLHGQRLVVDWTDGQPSGWAFGRFLDDASKAGYISQDLLLACDPAVVLSAGETCQIVESFHVPEEGYLTLARGDKVRVLAAESHYVWAYCELLSSRRPTAKAGSRGWAPEWVLSEQR